MNSTQSSAPPGQAYTMSASPLVDNLHQHHQDLDNGSVIPLGGATVEELENMQRYVAHQESMAGSHGMMVANGNLQALMEHNPLMMAMGMGGVENGMSLDPQLCSGDQYGPMVATAPMPGMPGDYPSMSGSGGSGGSSGSILTEFTKRRNWSQRILEELQDFLHILTPTGKIVYASESCKALTGFAVEDLLGKFIMDYLHEDDAGLFVRDFNESIASGRTLRLFYRFRKSDNSYAIFETHGHPHIAQKAHTDISADESVCKGFFMMARPYPTKNSALLDSFLEHKIENERLMKRINELRQEESEDQQMQRQRQQASRTESAVPSISHASSFSGNDTPMSGTHTHTPHSSDSMPPPAKPVSALTRENLGRMEASSIISRTEGIRDKMARFDPNASHIESIEMMTGLRYREGERSKGISTGDTSPALIRGDAGVPIPIDKENRQSSDKKKKQKIADEYVCTDCGTLDSPEWRKGPKGPKTLCNACGLRWAKKEKKRNANAGQIPSGTQGGAQVGG